MQGGLFWFGQQQAWGMEILCFSPCDRWCLRLLGVKPPRFLRRLFWDSLYHLFACVSGCVRVWALSVCVQSAEMRAHSLVQTKLYNKCPSFNICHSVPCLGDWQWLTATDTVPQHIWAEQARQRKSKVFEWCPISAPSCSAGMKYRKLHEEIPASGQCH